MFVKKGYCRFAGRKCRHLKVKDGVGECQKRRKNWLCRDAVIRDAKTGNPKNIPNDKYCNIKAPKWCHKLKH